ncbi:MAG TPA: hypothetical protein VG125_08405 [Pirellulales bacterium]|jgi:hypothetical protein|nr:hypothetical protein [Pirellulales bacterium]
MSRLRVLPGVLILLLFVTATASAQVTLKHKYAEGTQFKTQVTRKVDQQFNLAGMDRPSKVDMKLVARMAYGKRDAEKNVPVESKIESVTASLSLFGTNVTFDSTKPDEKPSDMVAQLVTDQLRKLTGMTFNYKVSPENKIIAGEQPKGETLVDPEQIISGAQQELDMIPVKPLKPGDKWERTVTEDIGGGQIFTFKRNYEYVGEVPEFATVPGSRKLDKITASDSSVEYSIKPNAAMGLTAKSSELKIESSKHAYLFDREAGRTVNTESEVRITGKLGLSINNMDLDGVLDLTMGTRAEEVK